METTRIVSCDSCGLVLDEPPDLTPYHREGCPSCGSRVRHVELGVFDTIKAHERISLKARHSSGGRPFRELVAGDDLYRDTERWNDLHREIDRLANRYLEKIVDPETGQIIRKVDEPLTDHIGHGSAKFTDSMDEDASTEKEEVKPKSE